jgi:hypothetical protein
MVDLLLAPHYWPVAIFSPIQILISEVSTRGQKSAPAMESSGFTISTPTCPGC